MIGPLSFYGQRSQQVVVDLVAGLLRQAAMKFAAFRGGQCRLRDQQRDFDFIVQTPKAILP